MSPTDAPPLEVTPPSYPHNWATTPHLIDASHWKGHCPASKSLLSEFVLPQPAALVTSSLHSLRLGVCHIQHTGVCETQFYAMSELPFGYLFDKHLPFIQLHDSSRWRIIQFSFPYFSIQWQDRIYFTHYSINSSYLKPFPSTWF